MGSRSGSESPPRFGAVPAPAPDWSGGSLPLPFWVVDAFTESAFTGNPAAVVLLPAGGAFPDSLWLSQVAREFAVSNTAFVSRRLENDGFALRWLTPAGASVAPTACYSLACSLLLLRTHRR